MIKVVSTKDYRSGVLKYKILVEGSNRFILCSRDELRYVGERINDLLAAGR